MKLKSSHILNLLLCTLLISSTSVVFAEEFTDDETVEGSALDSMEDLVSEFDEELNENDLKTLTVVDNSEADSEAEPEPSEPVVESEEATEAASKEATDNVVAPTPAVNPAPQANAEANKEDQSFDSILILKSDIGAKIWLNGHYRGTLSANKARAFPVKSGSVKITAKSGNRVKRFTKVLKAKNKSSVSLSLKANKKAKLKRALKKGIKRSVKKNAKKGNKANKKTAKGVKKAVKANKKSKKNQK